MGNVNILAALGNTGGAVLLTPHGERERTSDPDGLIAGDVS